MNILIVDDNLEVLSQIGSLLKRNDFNVWPASSAKRALGMAYHKIPDFIIIDLLMPEMNGYEFCEMLHLNPVTTNIPVAFMVKDVNSINENKLKMSGAIDIIDKPIDEEEFILKMEAFNKFTNERKKMDLNRNLNF